VVDVRLGIGVAEHTLNMAGVHFHNQVADTDEVKARGAEHAKKGCRVRVSLVNNETRVRPMRWSRNARGGGAHRSSLERGSI